MAGYFAPLAAWKAFEFKSSRVFDDFGVSVFHAKDFKDRNGEFKDWTPYRRNEFLSEWFLCAQGLGVFGISVSIKRNCFDRFKTADKRLSSLSPLMVSFGPIASMLCVGSSLPKFPAPDKSNFVIEAGNHNNSGILHSFNRLVQSKAYGENLGTLDFVPKDNCKAIQMADFWAYHSRKLCKKIDLLNENEPPPREVSIASHYVPHHLEMIFGAPSSPIGEPGRISPGISRRALLLPDVQ
jgi:hypothetical protein